MMVIYDSATQNYTMGMQPHDEASPHQGRLKSVNLSVPGG
jgi:hypothetical protein